jgi:hypothetical protein
LGEHEEQGQETTHDKDVVRPRGARHRLPLPRRNFTRGLFS